MLTVANIHIFVGIAKKISISFSGQPYPAAFLRPFYGIAAGQLRQ